MRQPIIFIVVAVVVAIVIPPRCFGNVADGLPLETHDVGAKASIPYDGVIQQDVTPEQKENFMLRLLPKAVTYGNTTTFSVVLRGVFLPVLVAGLALYIFTLHHEETTQPPEGTEPKTNAHAPTVSETGQPTALSTSSVNPETAAPLPHGNPHPASFLNGTNQGICDVTLPSSSAAHSGMSNVRSCTVQSHVVRQGARILDGTQPSVACLQLSKAGGIRSANENNQTGSTNSAKDEISQTQTDLARVLFSEVSLQEKLAAVAHTDNVTRGNLMDLATTLQDKELFLEAACLLRLSGSAALVSIQLKEETDEQQARQTLSLRCVESLLASPHYNENVAAETLRYLFANDICNAPPAVPFSQDLLNMVLKFLGQRIGAIGHYSADFDVIRKLVFNEHPEMLREPKVVSRFLKCCTAVESDAAAKDIQQITALSDFGSLAPQGITFVTYLAKKWNETQHEGVRNAIENFLSRLSRASELPLLSIVQALAPGLCNKMQRVQNNEDNNAVDSPPTAPVQLLINNNTIDPLQECTPTSTSQPNDISDCSEERSNASARNSSDGELLSGASNQRLLCNSSPPEVPPSFSTEPLTPTGSNTDIISPNLLLQQENRSAGCNRSWTVGAAALTDGDVNMLGRDKESCLHALRESINDPKRAACLLVALEEQQQPQQTAQSQDTSTPVVESKKDETQWKRETLEQLLPVFVEHGDFMMADRTIAALHQCGQVSEWAYEQAITLCCRLGHLPQALQYLNCLLARYKNLIIDTATLSQDDASCESSVRRSLRAYIQTLIDLQQYDEIFEYLAYLIESDSVCMHPSAVAEILTKMLKSQPDRRIASRVISILISGTSPTTLRQKTEGEGKLSSDAILRTCLTMDENLFAAAVDLCVKHRDHDALIQLTERYREEWVTHFLPDLQTCGILIKTLGACRRVDDSRWLFWHLAESPNVEPSEVTYGCILDALVNNNRVAEAVALFNDMKAKGRIKPNTIMYSTIVKGYAQEKQLDEALAIHDAMKAQQIPINTVTYNTLVDACARVGAMDRAASLLEDMLTSGVEPDLITFSTIAKGYCIQGDVSRAMQLLSAMRERGIRPDGILYNSLLDGCVRALRTDLCEQLWQQMQSSGIPPSNFTLTILIKMFGRAGRLTRAFEAVRQLPKKYGFRINAHVYTCLMSACIANREFSKALEVFQCMKKDRVAPDAKTYETVLFGLSRWGNFIEALKLIREAFQLDTGYGNRSRSNYRVVGLQMDPRSMRTLWTAMRDAGRLEMAEATIRDLSNAYGHHVYRYLPGTTFRDDATLARNAYALDGRHGRDPFGAGERFAKHDSLDHAASLSTAASSPEASRRGSKELFSRNQSMREGTLSNRPSKSWARDNVLSMDSDLPMPQWS